MENENMEIWEKSKNVPPQYLKKIQGGRLGRAGFHDINPMWRNRIMTEMFGPCGTGWKTEIIKLWTEPCVNDEKMWVAQISLQYRVDTGAWSEPVHGIGCKMVTSLERGKLHSSDEAVKMAVTDAESVAMKRIGVGASVYLGELDKNGKWDSKYSNGHGHESTRTVTPDQAMTLQTMIRDTDTSETAFCRAYEIKSPQDLPAEKYNGVAGIFMRKLQIQRYGKENPDHANN